ncbi:Hypothetical predicted protein [Paramuricea clavata]|uniref:Uncharacterized protein n=1 Tax=Paramuricea clavata TaxID=317549 RepID=A0A6S7HXT3_PARCT|nr:Hypothetical predicted protein [Paramuricea clavata]
MAEELQLAWMGDFDSLKQFVSEKLNLNGEWVSPGGDKKLFNDGYISISWRKNKKALLIDGDDRDKFKSKLCRMICANDFNKGNMCEETKTVNVECRSASPIRAPLSELSTEVEGIKLNVTIAEREIEVNKSAISKVESNLHEINSGYEDLRLQFDEYKKITEVLIQRDRFQHSTTFEYSNVIDKVNPSETKRYQDEGEMQALGS